MSNLKYKEMKKHILILWVSLLGWSCNGQEIEKKNEEKNGIKTEQPKGSWKVDKEFDEKGNLIRYDSIYSWSSNSYLDHFNLKEKDSLLDAFKSKFFTHYSGFENGGFKDVFAQDSLFSKHFFGDDFFNSDFGKDFRDIDNITQQIIARQKKFLEKYHSEFKKQKTKQ